MTGPAATTAAESPAVSGLVPVTPASSGAAIAFIAGRFSDRAAAGLDPAARAGTIRAARIVDLRRAGRLRAAERYGWLSLTGWLLDLPTTTLGRLNPDSTAFQQRSGRRDLLPVPLGHDAPPAPAPVAGTELAVDDPRDPVGWAVLTLAATALAGGPVDVAGRQLTGGAVQAALRARVEACRG